MRSASIPSRTSRAPRSRRSTDAMRTATRLMLGALLVGACKEGGTMASDTGTSVGSTVGTGGSDETVGTAGTGDETGTPEDPGNAVDDARKDLPTYLDLHQQVFYRTCTPNEGVCHNDKEYPDL